MCLLCQKNHFSKLTLAADVASFAQNIAFACKSNSLITVGWEEMTTKLF